MNTDDMRLLEIAIDMAWRARETGNHPFGAVLGRSGESLIEASNTVTTDRDVTGHAELNLVRVASRVLSQAELAECTLYSSTEPCAMCAGAIYWSGVGRVVYALPEATLGELTGADAENPTMHLPARQVLAAGSRSIEVEGPVDLPDARKVHERFWDRKRKAKSS